MDIIQNLLETSIELALQFNRFVYDQLAWMAGTFFVALPVFFLVLLITTLFGRLITAWGRFALWTLVLVRMILPVSIQSEASVQNLRTLANSTQLCSVSISPNWLLKIDDVHAPNLPPAGSLDDDDEPAKPPTLLEAMQVNLLPSLTTLMLAGMLVVAGTSLVAFLRLCSWLRYSGDCNDPYCIEEAEAARRSLGIDAPVKLRVVHQLTGAATFDLFRPVILLPESIVHLPPEQVRQIIWHEMARIRRADSATSFIHAAAAVLQWWNPLFWWASRRWKTEREHACDALLLNQLGRQSMGGFLEQLRAAHVKTPKRNLLTTDAPGFVMSLNSPAIERRRISALSSRRCSDGRGNYWFSWCLVVLIALTGLTDATPVPPLEVPIRLPAGATWHDADSINVLAEELEMRTYDMSRYLAGLGLKEQHFPQELREIAWTFNRMWNPRSRPDWITRPIDAESDSDDRESAPTSFTIPESRPGDRCHVNGHEITLRATPADHELVARMIESWVGQERPQITVEIRTVSTRLDPYQLVPAVGAKIFNSKPLVRSMDFAHPVAISGPPQSSASQSTQSPLPLLSCVLSPAQAQKLISRCQGDQRTSLMFAPKVTIFSFGSFAVRDERSRPFVTGMRTELTTKPRKEAWSEGLRLGCFAYTESGNVHLRIRCEISSIADLGTRKFQMDTDTDIQIPQLHSTVLETTAIVNDGATVMMVPLERDHQGLLTVILVTPRIFQIKSAAAEEAKAKQYIDDIKRLKTAPNEVNPPDPGESK